MGVVITPTPAQLTWLPLWETDLEPWQPCSGPGVSEAVALALRAREAAQWEDYSDNKDFQPWAGTINKKCYVIGWCSAESNTHLH